MPEPYENVYIGNFLYTLGYLSCRKKIDLSGVTIDLLQQTPADKTYGDLLSGINGKFLLVEFKRNESLVKSEFGKNQQRDLLEALNDNEHIHNLSLKSHFLGFGVQGEESNIIFLAYASIVNKTKQDRAVSIEFNSFCNQFLDSIVGASLPDFMEYIAFVRDVYDDPSDEPGGFVLIMDERCSVHLFRYESIALIHEILDKHISPPTQQMANYA